MDDKDDKVGKKLRENKKYNLNFFAFLCLYVNYSFYFLNWDAFPYLSQLKTHYFAIMNSLCINLVIIDIKI